MQLYRAAWPIAVSILTLSWLLYAAPKNPPVLPENTQPVYWKYEIPDGLENVSYAFPDGVSIRVHYSHDLSSRDGVTDAFARDVLAAAARAYQSLTGFMGFSTPGYSFARPDRSYAYDPDRTVDVFLGDIHGSELWKTPSGPVRAFRDAPCFDTVRVSETGYEAVILLPAHYPQFIKNWEQLNPSPLGPRNIQADLQGTLMHEMLHALLFYYNKNLTAASGTPADWYVEGLARYFETFADAKHDFFSEGFKQQLPDRIRFSRGGANYFMRYPDQAFTKLRYENALFWRFIDERFGMETIEKFSRILRDGGSRDSEAGLEAVTGVRMDEILKRFARCLILKDFNLKGESGFLHDIARTRLAYRGGTLYLVDGYDRKREVGKSCPTDWVGRWQGERAAFGEKGPAGDGTLASDVSGWATDFYEITADSDSGLPERLGVSHDGRGAGLAIQAVLMTRAGARLILDGGTALAGRTQWANLQDFIRAEGLEPGSVETLYLLITNTDPVRPATYQIRI